MFCVSVILAFALSSLPILPLLPESLKEVFTLSDKAKETYSLVYDLSLGYILSFVFYFMVDMLPDLFRTSRAKKLVKEPINQLLENMEALISVTLNLFNISVKLKDIMQKDLLVMDNHVFDNIDIVYYRTDKYWKNGKRITGVQRYDPYDKFVKDTIDSLLEHVEYLKTFEYFYSSELALNEVIRSINKSKFIKNYTKCESENNPCYLYSDTSKDFGDLIQLYRNLQKLNYHSVYSVSMLLSPEEEKSMRRPNMLGEIIEFNRKRNEEFEKIKPIIIYNRNSSNAKVLSTEIKNRIGASLFDIVSINDKLIRESKLIVLIVDKKSKRKFMTLIKNIEFPITVIVVSECFFIKKRHCWVNCHRNVNVKRTLSYISSIKIGNFLLLNKEHPTPNEMSKISVDIYDVLLKMVDMKFDVW